MSGELILGGVRVPIHASMEFQQSYEPIGGHAMHRLNNGTLVKQFRWRKIATSITARGTIPPALLSLDYDGTLVMDCAAPRSLGGTGLVYSLPAARRTDTGYTPRARALVGERWVPAQIDITDHVATLTAVANAVQYQVWYWPRLTVYCEPPSEQTDTMEADCGWTLNAEEV